MSLPNDPKPWVQPLFMVHDCSLGEKVPLTQERLDQLLIVESAYVSIISDIRRSHAGLCDVLGRHPQPFSDMPYEVHPLDVPKGNPNV